MRMKYEAPSINIMNFDEEDIVTSSSGQLNNFNGAKSAGKVDIKTFIGEK